MVYDAARGESVLFGGSNGSYLGDTWTFGIGGWSQRLVSPSPAPRAHHAMAYDPIRQKVVLLGGTDGTTLSDIWEWDGLAWVQRLASVPGISSGGSATYDPLQGGVFYGRSSNNLLWDGATVLTVGVAQPAGNSNSAMVFHAGSAGILRKQGSSNLRFSVPSGWQQLSNDATFGVSFYAIACDPVRNRVFLQGGDGYVGNGTGNGVGRTWQWNGLLWSQVAPAAPTLSRHAMIFDFARDTFVMFGGRSGQLSDSTWRWVDTGSPASFAVFGQGCSGSLPATPRLQADTLWNTAPVVGGQWFVRLDQCEPSRLVVGVVGLSNQVCNATSLPLSLAVYGMPGCDLLVSTDAVLTLGTADASGVVSWITSIPQHSALVGLEIFQQGAVLSPSANPTGIVWTNGGHAVLGT
jgi:hypothetical protein